MVENQNRIANADEVEITEEMIDRATNIMWNGFAFEYRSNSDRFVVEKMLRVVCSSLKNPKENC